MTCAFFGRRYCNRSRVVLLSSIDHSPLGLIFAAVARSFVRSISSSGKTRAHKSPLTRRTKMIPSFATAKNPVGQRFCFMTVLSSFCGIISDSARSRLVMLQKPDSWSFRFFSLSSIACSNGISRPSWLETRLPVRLKVLYF